MSDKISKGDMAGCIIDDTGIRVVSADELEALSGPEWANVKNSKKMKIGYSCPLNRPELLRKQD